MNTPPPSDSAPASDNLDADFSDASKTGAHPSESVVENSTESDSQPAMDPSLTTIQPGGGIVMSIELAWGKIRRRYLRALRPGYVRRMESTRRGNRGSLPFDPVDPRDVKYYRNQETYWWDASDDPFRWRDSLPFVRVGLA